MGEPGKMTIYRPSIKECNSTSEVRYRYNNKYETAIFSNDRSDDIQETVATDFARGFREYAFKNKNVNRGGITRKDALKIIQDIFKKNYNTQCNGLDADRAGALSEAKDIFDIYTDRDSDGGEMLTQKEQSEILHLYATKYGDIKNN